MEVASFVTSSRKKCISLENYILTYDKLVLRHRDEDTIYFIAKDTGRNEIYYHFGRNANSELAFNFDSSVVDKIKEHFKGLEIFLIDFSFKRNVFFENFISDFIQSLQINEKNDMCCDILLDHPHKGLLCLNEKGKFIQY